MKKLLVTVLLGALMAVSLVACASSSQSSAASASAESASAESASAESASAEAAASAAAAPTEAELGTIIVDEQAKSITAWGQVNGKYFTELTHHFLCNKDGKNGEKAVLRAWAKPADVYDALIKLGAKAGDNLAVGDESKGKFIEGDKIDVTVSWDGNTVPYSECIKTQDGSPYQADVRFGGNIDANNEMQTGCISCTFSCPVGIMSNAAYGYSTDDVYGNPDVLPADGTYVQVTYTLV